MTESDLGKEVWIKTSFGLASSPVPFCTEDRALISVGQDVERLKQVGWTVSFREHDLVRLTRPGFGAGEIAILIQRMTLK